MNPKEWKSVRPVRFRSQIFGALEYLSTKGRASIAELAKHTLMLRNRREEKRLQVLAIARTIGPKTKDPQKQPYLTKTEQLVRVLRATGLVSKKGDIVSCTNEGQELLTRQQERDVNADIFFLERLLNSRFVTYWLYLKQLFKVGSVHIPRAFAKRDRHLRAYLKGEGFPLSVWSFYAIRDLFYDFALTNYVISEEEEKIFPLYSLNSVHRKSYEAKIKAPEGYVYYWKRTTLDEFEDALVRSYLETSGGWDRMADMIELREKVSEKLKISEKQFDSLIKKEKEYSKKFEIHLSIGSVYPNKRRSYMTKFVSLPMSERGYPLTLIRMSQGSVKL